MIEKLEHHGIQRKVRDAYLSDGAQCVLTHPVLEYLAYTVCLKMKHTIGSQDAPLRVIIECSMV